MILPIQKSPHTHTLNVIPKLQVLDVVIHRFIELPPVSASLESLLQNFGALYKFHGE